VLRMATPGDRGKGRKYFFFEKKKQKTFACLVDAPNSTGMGRTE